MEGRIARPPQVLQAQSWKELPDRYLVGYSAAEVPPDRVAPPHVAAVVCQVAALSCCVYFSASSARFKSSTLTNGSPKMPRKRPVSFCITSWVTLAWLRPRSADMRGTW